LRRRKPMRTPSSILVVLSLAAAALTLSGCFNPELGTIPFQCAPSGDPCPEGYECRLASGTKDGVCVKAEIPPKPDASQPDKRILNDYELLPAKEGPVYLDAVRVAKDYSSCDDAASEPNNSVGTATKIPSGTTSSPDWEVCPAGDVDQFAISVKAGQKVSVKVVFTNSKGDLDAALVDPSGFVVDAARGTSDNETVGVDSASEAGTFIIGVWGYGAGTTNTYDLQISITN
jgi:hypothetical protein